MRERLISFFELLGCGFPGWRGRSLRRVSCCVIVLAIGIALCVPPCFFRFDTLYADYGDPDAWVEVEHRAGWLMISRVRHDPGWQDLMPDSGIVWSMHLHSEEVSPRYLKKLLRTHVDVPVRWRTSKNGEWRVRYSLIHAFLHLCFVPVASITLAVTRNRRKKSKL